MEEILINEYFTYTHKCEICGIRMSSLKAYERHIRKYDHSGGLNLKLL